MLNWFFIMWFLMWLCVLNLFPHSLHFRQNTQAMNKDYFTNSIWIYLIVDISQFQNIAESRNKSNHFSLQCLVCTFREFCDWNSIPQWRHSKSQRGLSIHCWTCAWEEIISDWSIYNICDNCYRCLLWIIPKVQAYWQTLLHSRGTRARWAPSFLGGAEKQTNKIN